MQQWHPVVDAVEGPTGAWHLVDAAGQRVGRIELRRVMNGTELRYRVEFRGDVIGWATSLRTACERLNQAFVRAHGPAGGAIAAWGGSPNDGRGRPRGRPPPPG